MADGQTMPDAAAADPKTPDMEPAAASGGEDKPMEMGSLPLPTMLGIIAATLACLLIAGWITSVFFAPITFG